MNTKQAKDGRAGILPFLRWAGSKRQHLTLLKSFWSEKFSRYVEPFAGSAVLFFHLRPSCAVLGDINKELIETYRTVCDNPKRVYKEMASFRKGRTNYVHVRNLDPDSLRPISKAARFIYLNRFCFNGLYRTNSKGRFNVPYGGAKSGTLPTLQHLKKSAEQLKIATLLSADFRKTIARVKKGDFVYLDPPYAVSNRRVFVEYSAKPFLVSDIAVLGRLLKKINTKGASFVLSYADCAEARRVFSGWKIKRVLTRRSVAGFHGARKNQYELCVTNLSDPITTKSEH